MTRTLVLTVDRDNDLCIKTAIRGPVVGRRQVLTAALKLGIADPEESDTNAILGALSQHDNLSESLGDDDEVEIAILTGDEKVGIRSDRAIAAQLEEIVTTFQPDKAILVTDGAEDESVLPIIQSQVRIDHVEKIIVKQSKGIEGTRVIQEMRDNADAAMFSSLLWTATVFSAIFAVAEGYQEYTLLVADSTTSVLWLEVTHAALAWIVIAFLTSTAGFIFLRLRRGAFSGRLIVLGIFGMVVYSFVDSALQISTNVLNGQSYEFSVNQILDDLFYPIIWVVVLWMATTIKNSLQAKQAQSERYWGI